MATKYEPDRNGMRELSRLAGVQGVALEAGRAVADAARALDPRGGYEVRAATVTAGWQNEHRAGAEVVETDRAKGAHVRALARASQTARL